MSAPEVQDRMNAFIDRYEKKFLREFLGPDLYSSFKTNAIDITPAEQKWTDLLNGVDFTASNSRKYSWIGFKGSGAFPQSPIANYVYYFWQKDQVTQTTALGEVSSKSENATLVSPAAKMVRAWNEMIDMLGPAIYYLDTNRDNYPGWAWQNYYWRNRFFDHISEYGI